jgi:hypothetical protein
VFSFFPEMNQLELEDIDHLFERGGVTDCVFRAKGWRTVETGEHERESGVKEGKELRFRGEKVEVETV